MKHVFVPLLEGLGSHSVTILGSKSHLKIDQKINAILDRFLNDFGPFLGSMWGPLRAPGCHRDAPKTLQDAPGTPKDVAETPQEAPGGTEDLQDRFLTIFHRFFIEFSLIFHRFSIDFSSIFSINIHRLFIDFSQIVHRLFMDFSSTYRQ